MSSIKRGKNYKLIKLKIQHLFSESLFYIIIKNKI